jgi:hypothetical protein
VHRYFVGYFPARAGCYQMPFTAFMVVTAAALMTMIKTANSAQGHVGRPRRLASLTPMPTSVAAMKYAVQQQIEVPFCVNDPVLSPISVKARG